MSHTTEAEKVDFFAELIKSSTYKPHHVYWARSLMEHRKYNDEDICQWLDQIDPRSGDAQWSTSTNKRMMDKMTAAGLSAKDVAEYLLDQRLAVPSMNIAVLKRKFEYEVRESVYHGMSDREIILLDTPVALGSPRYMNGDFVRTELPTLVETFSALQDDADLKVAQTETTKSSATQVVVAACKGIREIDYCLSDRLRTAVALRHEWPRLTECLDLGVKFPHALEKWLNDWTAVDSELVREAADAIPGEEALESEHFREWAQRLP